MVIRLIFPCFIRTLMMCILLINVAYCVHYQEPVLDGESTGHGERHSETYKVITEAIRWMSDTSKKLFYCNSSAENACVQGDLLAWVDEKSVLRVAINRTACHAIIGFTDPHALCCCRPLNSVFFVSGDDVYSFNRTTQKCDKQLTIPGIGSGGAKILSNGRHTVIAGRKKNLNVIFILEFPRKKSALCFQHSTPITNLLVTDDSLFFVNNNQLYRYPLR